MTCQGKGKVLFSSPEATSGLALCFGDPPVSPVHMRPTQVTQLSGAGIRGDGIRVGASPGLQWAHDKTPFP